MLDYFKSFMKTLDGITNIVIQKRNIIQQDKGYSFDLFEHDISDEVKYLYNHYSAFNISWEESSAKIGGWVEFIPYERIVEEHKELNEMAECVEKQTEEDTTVLNDLKNWYPLFRFPNGDAFCYDKRNGKVVFFEHEVFDTGMNLHGLVIADSIECLLEKWSKALFIDIYDWTEGVDEHGINLNMPVYERVQQLL